MRDVDLRGALLQKLYLQRSDRHYLPEATDFSPAIAPTEIIRIARQLKEHGLVDANVVDTIGGESHLLSIAISARGVDVVEGSKSPDISIDFANTQTVNVSGSSNVVVGNYNTLSVQSNVEELVKLIEASKGTPESKAEAKGLLRRFLEHPLLAAAAGGAIGLL